MESVKEEIEKLKKEKRAVILAHYYVPGEVQEIADYIGDSYFLSKKARETDPFRRGILYGRKRQDPESRADGAASGSSG